MTQGLRALAAATTDEPLPFRIRMYVGSLMVTGRIAPAHWWYDLTRRAMEAELDTYQASGDTSDPSRRSRFRPRVDREKSRALLDQTKSSLMALQTAERGEGSEVDEVTLIDVRIYPANFRNDTKGGCQNLAVVRIPVSSISLWWIIEEETLPGSPSAGAAWGVGVIFPIG